MGSILKVVGRASWIVHKDGGKLYCKSKMVHMLESALVPVKDFENEPN